MLIYKVKFINDSDSRSLIQVSQSKLYRKICNTKYYIKTLARFAVVQIIKSRKGFLFSYLFIFPLSLSSYFLKYKNKKINIK